MTRIVTTHYRYKRPPRKRAKAAAIEGPVIITIPAKKRRSVSWRHDTSDEAKPPEVLMRINASDEPQASPPPANDDRRSVIVTARRPGKRYADVPDVTEEEHRRVGDLADAMFQEMKRRIAEKVRK